MIQVNIKENEQKFHIEITGHAEFANSGNDIVCASVSSVVFTTVNSIIRINKDTIEYEKGKKFIIDVVKNEVNNHLIENLIQLLSDIEVNYEKNIKINREVSK